MFGSKALRTTFAETVTWGRPENTLRVELMMDLGGRGLTIVRGKSGAEVIENGNVIVTGQNEVTAFVSNLLGCDGAAAANLIIASQNAMRGSLEQGPKATAQLIEQLADFDLFDVLIERIQTKLVVGAPASFEARLKEAESQLASFDLGDKPDAEAHQAHMEGLTANIEVFQKALTESLKPAARQARKALEEVELRNSAYNQVLIDIGRADERFLKHRQEKADLEVKASELRCSPDDIAAAKAAVVELEKAARAVDAYKVFKALPQPPNEYEGNYEEFTAWASERAGHRQALREDRIKYTGQISLAEMSITTSSVCGFCGQDVSAFPDVAKRNQEAEDEIASLRARQAQIDKGMKEVEAEIAAAEAIKTCTASIKDKLTTISDFVAVDNTITPPAVTWHGEPPEPVDLTAARAHVAKLEKDDALAVQYEVRADALKQILTEDQINQTALRKRLSELPEQVPAEDLRSEVERTTEAVNEADAFLSSANEAAAKAREAFNVARVSYDLRVEAQVRLEKAVASARADLDSLGFNNTLLKKVRAARPIIGDKLWNTVLAAVSTMFSQMRGEPSVVSKDSGGFKVNGQTVESLSGSTLDILGLARPVRSKP